MTRAAIIEPSALPERITRRKEPLVADRVTQSRAGCRRAGLHHVGAAGRGRQQDARAEVLGIDPSTLYRKLSRCEETVVKEV